MDKAVEAVTTFTVRLFGPLSRAAGSAEVAITLAGDPPTCRELRGRISACEPSLTGYLPGCRFAVNGRFADDEQALQAGDEIALIGFVSGG